MSTDVKSFPQAQQNVPEGIKLPVYMDNHARVERRVRSSGEVGRHRRYSLRWLALLQHQRPSALGHEAG